MASVTQNSAVAPHLLSPVGNQVSVADVPQKSQVPAPRDTVATLNYYKDPADGGPPHATYTDRPETYYREPLSKQVTIHDIRGSEDQYTLDTTGFQIVKHESAEKEFLDDDQIKAVYYPEVENILKQATGASRILIFDHTIRRQPPAAEKTRGANNTSNPGPPLRGPVQRVHIDQSYKAGHDRVPHHLPEEAETLLKGRHQIINVWRPIKTILKDPLGVASANSILEEELVVTPLISPTRNGETFAVRPPLESRTDGGHVWNYLFGQRPDEVTLIKCFDSKTDGRARRAPHSAFVDEEFEDREPRESIEVRALVLTPEDTE